MKIKYFTIAIPTFNRINSLKNLLISIISEIDKLKNVNKEFRFNILISINSGADPREELFEEFKCIKNNKNINELKVIYRPINLLFAGHISQIYADCKKGYIWFIGDDDVIIPGALTYIFKVLKKLYKEYNGKSVLPPIYGKWKNIKESFTLEYKDNLYDYLDVDGFCALKDSTFFISATIMYKEKESFIPPIHGFTQLFGLLYQGIKANQFIRLNYPIIAYNPVSRYKSNWLNLFFYHLPNTLSILRSHGLSTKNIKNIIHTSLINKTALKTTFYIANESAFEDKFYAIASIYKFRNFYKIWSYPYLLILLIISSPIFPFLKSIKNLFLKNDFLIFKKKL